MPRRRSGDCLSMRLQGSQTRVNSRILPNKGKTSAENLRSDDFGRAWRSPKVHAGGARFAAPGICSPNCASHRGFGAFEGIVCRDIRHWRMIHGASHPNAGSGSVLIVAAGFHLFRSAVGAYSENGDNCPMQLRRRVQTHRSKVLSTAHRSRIL